MRQSRDGSDPLPVGIAPDRNGVTVRDASQARSPTQPIVQQEPFQEGHLRHLRNHKVHQ